MRNFDFSQHDHFSIKGYWWLPNVCEKVVGELFYTEGKLTLDLLGGLSDAKSTIPLTLELNEYEHQIIHGISEDNVQLTIFNSFYLNWNFAFHDALRPQEKVKLKNSKLSCSLAIIGDDLLQEETKLTYCRLEIAGLDNWLGNIPYTVSSEGQFEKINLTYLRPNEILFETIIFEGKFNFIYTVKPPSLPFGHAPSISHNVFLQYESQTPISISDLIIRSSKLVDLLSIFYGDSVVPIRTFLLNSSRNEKYQVFYPRLEAKKRSFKNFDFLIKFKEIEDRFEAILHNFSSSNFNTYTALNLLLSSEISPSDYIENRFIPLIHAIEVLSNDAHNALIVDNNEFKKIRNKMIDAIKSEVDEELIEGITNSLQWANGRNLRKKIRCIMGELKEETCLLFSINKEKFINGIVSTRNYYTHHSTKSGKNVLNGIELHWSIQKMTLFIRIYLMYKFGVSENLIFKAVENHHRSAEERKVWNKLKED